MSDYELVPIDPIRKLESEVEELKQYLKSLKEEIKISTEEYIKRNENNKKSTDFANEHLLKVLIDYSKTNQEIINSLIRSNIELQSKIAELVVVTNELNKNINRLVEIFKEAALEYMEKIKEGKNEKKDENSKILSILAEKFESIEKLNLKIAEAIEKLSESIEDLKNKPTPNKNINILPKKSTKLPLLPPRFPPAPPHP